MPDIDFDLDAPLAHVHGESKKANAALRDYAQMKAGRSLRNLHARYLTMLSDGSQTELPPTSKWGTVATWSWRYGWVERAGRWDELEREREEAQWAARRLEVREADWKQSGLLRDLAGRILAAAPTFVRRGIAVREEGKPTIITNGVVTQQGEPAIHVETVALNPVIMLQSIKTASSLARQAVDLPTAREDHHVEFVVTRQDEDAN